MPFAPEPVLSETDRKLVALLASILARAPTSDNETADLPTLSDEEALRLLSLLEKLLENRRFQNSSYFTQEIWSDFEDRVVRRIYSVMRRSLGKTTVMASRNWGELHRRLKPPRQLSYPRINPTIFTFADFIKYEDRLFHAAGIDLRVRNVLTRFLLACESELEEVRASGEALRRSPADVVSATCEAIRLGVLKWKVGLDLKTPRYASLLTIVVNAGAMFTTRDWTAVGTLSTTAAVIGADLQASKRDH